MTLNVIGHDDEIIDETVPPDVAELTGRPHLLSTNGGATPTVTSRADSGNATLDAQLEVLLSSGASEVVVQGYDATVGGLPSLAEAVALLPAGPGTVLAPEAVLSADIIALAPAWTAGGKAVLANSPTGSTVAQAVTLAGAVKSGVDARGVGLWKDWITHGLSLGTANLPATFGVAAAIARNDVATNGNTGKAAAGKNGVIRGGTAVVGGAPTQADINTLAAAQVNSVKVFGSEIRNYGFRSLADLTNLPIRWRDLAGTRVLMDVRGKFASLNEETIFEQMDGEGLVLDRIVSLRAGVLYALWKVGALYGDTPSDAFRIDVGPTVNTLADIQAGRIKVRTYLRTSPTVEHVLDQIVPRPITSSVD